MSLFFRFRTSLLRRIGCARHRLGLATCKYLAHIKKSILALIHHAGQLLVHIVGIYVRWRVKLLLVRYAVVAYLMRMGFVQVNKSVKQGWLFNIVVSVVRLRFLDVEARVQLLLLLRMVVLMLIVAVLEINGVRHTSSIK